MCRYCPRTQRSDTDTTRCETAAHQLCTSCAPDQPQLLGARLRLGTNLTSLTTMIKELARFCHSPPRHPTPCALVNERARRQGARHCRQCQTCLQQIGETRLRAEMSGLRSLLAADPHRYQQTTYAHGSEDLGRLSLSCRPRSSGWRSMPVCHRAAAYPDDEAAARRPGTNRCNELRRQDWLAPKSKPGVMV